MNRILYLLKVLCLTIVELCRQAWFLPQAVAASFRGRRHRTHLNEAEAERLDRIRQPSKYLGKED